MERRLAEIEIERCNLRAALADKEMQEAWARRSGVSHECLALRKARRELEKGLQHAIPPGPWDYDLDQYPVGEYKVDLGDGYEGILRRSRSTWTWLGYVRLPAGHCCVGKDYGDLSYTWHFPMELTYGPSTSLYWEKREADLFGFDHQNRHDLAPFHHFTGSAEDRYADKGEYTSYHGTLEKLRQLKAHFQMLEKNHREEILDEETEEAETEAAAGAGSS
jgi:hypothetical protein